MTSGTKPSSSSDESESEGKAAWTVKRFARIRDELAVENARLGESAEGDDKLWLLYQYDCLREELEQRDADHRAGLSYRTWAIKDAGEKTP